VRGVTRRAYIIVYVYILLYPNELDENWSQFVRVACPDVSVAGERDGVTVWTDTVQVKHRVLYVQVLTFWCKSRTSRTTVYFITFALKG